MFLVSFSLCHFNYDMQFCGFDGGKTTSFVHWRLQNQQVLALKFRARYDTQYTPTLTHTWRCQDAW